MRLKRVHHIDFAVRDLDRAIEKYRRFFQVPLETREHLDNRGVELARFRLGGTWIVLVQPTRPDSPIQQFIDRYGEGFYHIAYEVDNLNDLVIELQAQGAKLGKDGPRRGLEDWKLVDIDRDEMFGIMTQLVEPS